MTKSQLTRQHCLLDYGKIQSTRRVALLNKVSKSSISSWVREARGLASRVNTKPNTKKKWDTIFFIIKSQIKENPFLSLANIQEVLQELLKVKYSITQIHRLLKRLRITRKRTKRIVRKSQAYIEMLKIRRSEFIERMRSIIIQEVISIDESGFHKQMSNKYAYSSSGSKVYHQTTSQHHQNYSLILAISSSLVISSKIVKGGVNKKIFTDFLQNDLLPACGTRKYTFLLDNVRFHHNKYIKNLIENEGHTIQYTPPDLNPVEHVFSMIKSTVRKINCSSVFELVNTLKTILQQINGFENMFTYSLSGSELSNESRARIIIN